MTVDQHRRQIRANLHRARVGDGDHSELRLWQDARILDTRMTALGHPPPHPTTWGTSPARTAAAAARRGARSHDQAPQQPQT
jgi:hypothetical protein